MLNHRQMKTVAPVVDMYSKSGTTRGMSVREVIRERRKRNAGASSWDQSKLEDWKLDLTFTTMSPSRRDFKEASFDKAIRFDDAFACR